jgi:hypothetical protein
MGRGLQHQAGAAPRHVGWLAVRGGWRAGGLAREVVAAPCGIGHWDQRRGMHNKEDNAKSGPKGCRVGGCAG